MFKLLVRQQPERARLCSFKEENETIDRRPIDPPPIVEMQSSSSEALESSFFIRAAIVSQDQSDIKTPTGADPTAGEVLQTPEKLKQLNGRPGALCIFAKLSVRMPGVFRLRFSLYQISDHGIAEVASTVSEPFEVFSPKLFRGMKESTALTRHLAAQGIKVKLRTDTTVGRDRKRATVWTPAYEEPIPRHGGDDGLPLVLRRSLLPLPSSDLSAFSLQRNSSQSSTSLMGRESPLPPISHLNIGPGDDGFPTTVVPPRLSNLLD